LAQRDEKKDVSLSYSKSYLNFRVHHDMGKMDASLAVASVIFNKSPFKKTYRYMDGYRAGLVGPELDYAIKKYKGHRMIPRENLEIIQSELKKQQEDKLKATFKSC
jgi:hypothetical protein